MNKAKAQALCLRVAKYMDSLAPGDRYMGICSELHKALGGDRGLVMRIHPEIIRQVYAQVAYILEERQRICESGGTWRTTSDTTYAIQHGYLCTPGMHWEARILLLLFIGEAWDDLQE